ncbi:hypothetical protein CFC21_016962 [Triticum aestivum]|uniref:C2 domain-containing protein n=3 Tax=Triticum TaxID=4564 RepID=A0A9R1R7D3_TRITD|nr:protein C2-DOMAIN ABA-RELATED 5-like [Triticum dicoccoides]XP_044453178.1 protein C2-DOMAIN ABA-RELATED 5-like [Triticum aestivum]KAF7001252.1 hypothetical protein CFC21_016962 [Triticum aestivum]VAH30988.1 unnamed protein product [Triticum turgidum subsp. durum]
MTSEPVPPGMLSVRVLRGINLVNCDANGSDPYVVLELDNQKVMTNVIKKTVNPVWNKDLTLAVTNPTTSIKIEVFDKDKFSKDDKMGDAEVDLEPLLQMARMDLEDIRSGTVVRTVRPHRGGAGGSCCLADESSIVWEEGQVVQDALLKLRNVATGIIHLQLRWVKIPSL